MDDMDVRWMQRMDHFRKALQQLREAEALAETRQLSKLEEQGMIQTFEYTHELAWNLLKDFLESRGAHSLYGSRDVVRTAFRRGVLTEGQVWMDMIDSRNLTSHTYDERIAQRVLSAIRKEYLASFEHLEERMQAFTRVSQDE